MHTLTRCPTAKDSIQVFFLLFDRLMAGIDHRNRSKHNKMLKITFKGAKKDSMVVNKFRDEKREYQVVVNLL